MQLNLPITFSKGLTNFGRYRGWPFCTGITVNKSIVRTGKMMTVVAGGHVIEVAAEAAEAAEAAVFPNSSNLKG